MTFDFVPFEGRPGIAAKHAMSAGTPKRWTKAAEPFEPVGNEERLICERAWAYALADGRQGPGAEHWARAEREVASHAAS